MARRNTIRNIAEGAGLVLGYGLVRLLPVDWSSAIGGFLARTIGPHLGISKRAEINLANAMPELTAEQRRQTLVGMWDNLGRVMAEYPHLDKFRLFEANARVEFIDGGNVLAARARTQKTIFFGAHCGNWEIAIPAATQLGFEVTGVYRAPNNPVVDRFMLWARGVEGGELVPKGDTGARKALSALREGRALCMLVDQKMNDGIPVPFFGRDAMTAPALAMFALRYDCTVMPIRMERTRGAHFRIITEPPLALTKTGDNDADQRTLMTEVNAIVERWVRERPEQWLWLHRRWPD
ncbi:MAG TPA: lauroyl acyltransferase [Stellaceae bacterium]|nr:lauroyl acyltransferase [Stellaceae bacterium]